jgi:transcriptional regulator with XRE-family HTH domain
MENINISAIEQYVIDRVRDMRLERGISQKELADMVDISPGFIGKVESTSKRAKYNFNHINAFAKVFKCSLKDFLRDEPF